MNDRTSQATAGAGSPDVLLDAIATRRVVAAVAPLLAEPRAAATQTSQYLKGHLLTSVEERGDWLRMRGRDGYEGWMHRGYLAVDDGRSGTGGRMSLGCTVRNANGKRQALPLGALLDDADSLVDGEILPVGEQAAQFPGEGTAIAGSAIRFFEGSSYLWGGVTPWGADCSGFVQTILALHGIPLPRDASDQGRCGIEVPATADALTASDLVFFSDREDGRITHVAIAIGHGRMVHLALGRGGYAVETLRGDTDPYASALRGRIRFARRVVGVAPSR